MKVQVTFDKKGISVWPYDGVILKYDKESQEWFDIDCEVRGTDGLDYESLERMIGRDVLVGEDSMWGKKIILEVNETGLSEDNGSMP